MLYTHLEMRCESMNWTGLDWTGLVWSGLDIGGVLGGIFTAHRAFTVELSQLAQMNRGLDV